MKIIFFALTFCLSSLSFADTGAAQKARFNAWLSVLEKPLTSSEDADKVAAKLVQGESRIASFNLQALGKLYSSQDKQFSKLFRQNFKELEDGIGQFDMWTKIAEKSGKQKDKDKAAKAKADLAALLVKKNWIGKSSSTRLAEIKTFIQSYEWAEYGEDKALVLADLTAQLQKLEATEYDVSRLELKDGDGNGLHELRREIRWFLIEARVLNGLLIFDESSDCSIEAFADLPHSDLAESKYAKLPWAKTEEDPCAIEQCLFLGLVKNVNVLGEIKDAAEQDEEARESDAVSGDLLKKAQTAYKELRNTKIFSKLQKNIGQCIK